MTTVGETPPVTQALREKAQQGGNAVSDEISPGRWVVNTVLPCFLPTRLFSLPDPETDISLPEDVMPGPEDWRSLPED